ncbi:MAG: S41 family peptidase [bacterium]|nr:S41 family peptidase [bacterium]
MSSFYNKFLLIILIFINIIYVNTLYAKNFNSTFELLRIVRYHIENEYVEKNIDSDKLEYGAIKGLLKSLKDPYTRFMEPKSTNEMRTRMHGSFYGIGIHIGIKKQQLTVISPISGTPAYKAGLKSLDKIMKINGISTKGMSLTEAVSKIRGKKGTKVVLGIKRAGTPDILNIDIIRNEIKLNAVEKEELFTKNDKNIGYILLSTFENKRASYELAKSLKKLILKDIECLVLDLRYNGGGLLQNALDIANLFLTKGSLVHTVDRDKYKSTSKATKYTLFPDKPLVVLVNEGSASASEIVAGAIKDNKRGLIVGKKTFGKASVQRILNLPDGSSVLYTTAKYYTPNNTDITEKGITVDIKLTISTENITLMQKPDFEYSFETDYQLQEAIKIALEQISKL